MAFQIPKFNVWMQGLADTDAGLIDLGYTRCQLRANRPNLVGRFYNLPIQLYDNVYVEVLLPAGTDIRSYLYASGRFPFGAEGGDILRPLGIINTQFVVQSVFDVGPGFSNEFRVALCRIDTFEVSDANPYNNGQMRINPDLEPPDGFEPVVVLPRAPAE